MNFWRTLFDRQLKPYKPAYPVTAVTQPTPTGTTISAAPLPFQTLTLSSTAFVLGTPASGAINNALFNTVIVPVGLPNGLSINSGARTWAWIGSGSNGSGSFTLYENTPGAPTNPHASVISYTIASSGVTLGALTLSSTAFITGITSSGLIFGATTGSTITASGLPTGLTINGAGRTWAWDGTGTVSTGSFTLTETLAGATNTPLGSTINYSIGAAPSSVSAPVLAQTSTAGTSPFTWDETLDATNTAGLRRHLQIASDSGFTTLLYDLYKPVLESEFNGNDTIWGSGTDNPPRDYTTDVWTYLGLLSGSIYVRERLERDDGVNSAWSNVLHDTITANQSTQWRLHVTSSANGGSCVIGEIAYRTVIGNAGSSVAPSSVTASSTYSGDPVGQGPAKAVDGNAGTWWSSDTLPADFDATFGSAIGVLEVAITAGNNGSVAGSTPKDFILQRWNGSAWVNTITVTGQLFWGAGETRTFS